MINKLEIINYIIKNKCTANDASKFFNCSISTIRGAIAYFKNSSNSDDYILYQKYLDVARYNERLGRVKGGTFGKRKSIISDDDLYSYYYYIVDSDCSLSELSKLTGIPKSTIFDNLKRLPEPYLQILKEVLEAHKHQSNSYDADLENSQLFHKVGSDMAKRVTSVRVK